MYRPQPESLDDPQRESLDDLLRRLRLRLGLPQAGSLGRPQAGSLGLPQHGSLGRPQPESLDDLVRRLRLGRPQPESPQPGSLGRPQPRNLERPQPGNLGLPQPRSMGRPQPESLGRPQSESLGDLLRRLSLGRPQPGSLERSSPGSLQPAGSLASDLSDEQVKRNAAVLRQMRLHNGPGSQDRYTQSDLVILQTKASQHNSQRFRPFRYLYRDKTAAYFDDILNARGGIMGTYVKDLNGDPRSPINGKLHGLFFNTLTDITTDLPKEPSIFGDTRLRVPVRNLVTMETNMYFADFYCIRVQHYVTLVVATRGSRADDFCKKNLLHVPFSMDSPFFRYNHASGCAYTSQSHIVEVFYTEGVDVDLELSRGASLQKVNMIGSRSGGYIGLAKNSDCRVCNI